MKFWWKVVKILIWLKLLPVFVCSFVASRDNFQMVQTLAHLPWWRACSLLIISFSIDGVWKTEKREIESACKTQSMKCKYVVKFRLVQTISQTVFYMRNFTTLYMFACCTEKSTLFIIMTISHQLGGWLKWNAFLSLILNEFIHSEIAEQQQRKLRNGNALLNLFERRNFKTMSKLKCSIYSHHKWIYCIFIKLNERNG